MNSEKISEILILRFVLLMMNPEPQVLDLPYSTGVYMMYVCVIIIHSVGTLDDAKIILFYYAFHLVLPTGVGFIVLRTNIVGDIIC